MIRRLLNALRRARIDHHNRVAALAGAATLAAQIDRDWAAAGERMREMHVAQAKRDALIRRYGACPPCNHNCYEGTDCPRRA